GYLTLIELEAEKSHERTDGLANVSGRPSWKNAPIQVKVVGVHVNLVILECDSRGNVQGKDLLMRLPADHCGNLSFGDTIQSLRPRKEHLLVLEHPEHLDRVCRGEENKLIDVVGIAHFQVDRV